MRTASPQAMAIVKSTAPALEKHGVEITTAMYARLFQNPAIEALFDKAAQRSGEQPRRLAGAILASRAMSRPASRPNIIPMSPKPCFLRSATCSGPTSLPMRCWRLGERLIGCSPTFSSQPRRKPMKTP